MTIVNSLKFDQNAEQIKLIENLIKSPAKTIRIDQRNAGKRNGIGEKTVIYDLSLFEIVLFA